MILDELKIWSVSIISNFVCKEYMDFFFKVKKKSLFLAALGLRCFTRAFSSCVVQRLLFIAVHGFLTVVTSLAMGRGLLAHGLPEFRLAGSGVQAQ